MLIHEWRTQSGQTFIGYAIQDLAAQKRAAGQMRLSSSTVRPMPLPPEVANGTIVLPEKSQLSRNVAMMRGATYHHMGKPI